MSSPTSAAGDPVPAPPGRPKSRFLLVSLLVVALDQWSKWLIETHLPVHATQPVLPGLLNLTHVRNSGVAFGLFAAAGRSDGGVALILVGAAALALVALYFWRTPRTESRLLAALALVLGGAVGNLVDRVSRGAVTDFIDFYLGIHHWHTFNLADSAITVGILWMIADLVLHRPQGDPAAVHGAGR